MQKISDNFIIPKKENRNGIPLTQAENDLNLDIATVRVMIERTYGRLKTQQQVFGKTWSLKRSRFQNFMTIAVGIQNFLISKHPMNSRIPRNEATEVSPQRQQLFRAEAQTQVNDDDE
ncbi:Harbinger_transposase-derived nuclease domain [Hexamita inflata]|uniref:Harbinger transposase-derived nuclease domain n=1 Tax=Hexamita inflata TaxID=28002 RepID=A0AA86U7V9_9EUKA|nr:Harbinger transposase-derived nuclease domain [Hexamita inflata]